MGHNKRGGKKMAQMKQLLLNEMLLKEWQEDRDRSKHLGVIEWANEITVKHIQPLEQQIKQNKEQLQCSRPRSILNYLTQKYHAKN